MGDRPHLHHNPRIRPRWCIFIHSRKQARDSDLCSAPLRILLCAYKIREIHHQREPRSPTTPRAGPPLQAFDNNLRTRRLPDRICAELRPSGSGTCVTGVGEEPVADDGDAGG